MLAESYKDAQVIERYTKEGKAYARVKITCDRCGGRGIFAVGVHNGQLVPAQPDAGMCYKCLGAGYLIKEVRDYSQVEYERMQRAKAKRESAKQAQRELEEEKRKEAAALHTLNIYGFSGTTAYAVVGNTYELRSMLLAHGAKFSRELLWVCPEEPTWLPADRYVPISVTDIFELKNGWRMLKDSATDFIQSLQPTIGKHLGVVGSKLTVQVKVVKRLEFDYRPYPGSWSSTSYKYIMETPDGDTVVWSTSSVRWEEGYECTLAGTVKEHAEYKHVRQTVLTRCKEVTL